ncbi:hypothetical protein QQS21_006646 [Conoideocrella luteorostrata]|uniref:Uncharacterized protein n=1 Tax=Conoideocrella luteorostrata TaxID=1105319 RepID=A0AAJ0CMA5_9HYPO|nr:hypothetical protein QQS21_006646 [Conoideocrella luteorostrata]
MKYINALIVLAAAAIAAPCAPDNNHPPPPSNGGGKCNNNNPHYVCCNGLISGLLCNLNLVGESCSGGSYCCESAPQNGLINIGLNCLRL